jgi:hypothetical protein
MSLKDDFKKQFIPEQAYFTFWLPQAKQYSTDPHRYGTVTDAEIDLHLTGKQGLTMSPFIDEKNVLFGTIDIDVPDFGLVTEICTRLQKKGINPNIFESKRKGYHIYIFPESPVSAVQMRQAIKSVVTDDISVRDEKSVIDIFPAQDKNPGKGGNKVNLPFFGDTRRQLSENGQVIKGFNASSTPSECFDQLPVEPAEEERHQEKEVHTENNGSYPCINNILNGVEEGSRNELGFELGRYLISHGTPLSAVHTVMLDWNKKNKPPLLATEINTTIHSLREDRSNNAPDCNNPKIKPFCDAARCSKAEITICDDPKIIRKHDGYYVHEQQGKSQQQMKRASNFTLDVVGGDRELKMVELIVHYKDRHERIRLQNPTWSKFLTECSLRGLACDHYGKIKLSVLIAVEVSPNPSVIDDTTDVDAMDLEKVKSFIMEEIRHGGIPMVEKDVILLSQDIVSGWRKNGVLYLRIGRMCAKNHIDPKKLAGIFRGNGIEQKSVRAPIADSPSMKVWVLDWPEEEEANTSDEDDEEDNDE